MSKNELKPKLNSRIIILTTLVTTFLYSLIRYNVFGKVSYVDIPTYILNKSVAFTIIILLPFILFFKAKKMDVHLKILKQSLQFLLLIHVLLSVCLLSPSYYSKLFIGNKLSLFGNLAILTGVLAISLSILYQSKINYIVLYALVALHLIFIGGKGWFEPSKWYGYLAPISLICFLILIVVMIISHIMLQQKNKQDV
ncbi:MAG: hypothetical protein WCG08_09885 [Paludibacter sp.]